MRGFFELPSDVVDAVLCFLPASPDLFEAMCVCKAWRDYGRAHYLHTRVVTVPSAPDALVRAVGASCAGDTLRLQPGVHLLYSELTIDRPLRLLSESEADNLLAPPARPAEEEEVGGRPRRNTPPAADNVAVGAISYLSDGEAPSRQRLDVVSLGSSTMGVGDAVVLVATLHVLLRTRCTTYVAGLTLCRMGDEVGYPNAVTYAEAGKLRMERCRVTCGGLATSVPQALQTAFDGAPEPGTIWLSDEPLFDAEASNSARSGNTGTGSSHGSSRSFLIVDKQGKIVFKGHPASR